MKRCRLANKHGENNMKKNQNKYFIENFNMKGTYLCMKLFTPEFGRRILEARKLPKTMSARNQLRVDRKQLIRIQH